MLAALMPELIKENKLDELQKEVTSAFKGPGGFLELAAAEEKVRLDCGCSRAPLAPSHMLLVSRGGGWFREAALQGD